MSPDKSPDATPEPANGPPDSFLTLAQEATTEIKIQRSRFIAVVSPVLDEPAARRVIAAQAKRYHDARHVCHGWRLGAPPHIAEGRNDDGEPSGTAGEPILAEIRKRDLTRVVVVVVRYFGGIKLGTGGLARAYGQAAATALVAAPLRTVLQGRRFVVAFPYALQKTLRHLLAAHDGKVLHEDYGATVQWTLWLPHSRWAAFQATLTETTAGAVQLAIPPQKR
jgi:uncharacterized YigZ family protein